MTVELKLCKNMTCQAFVTPNTKHPGRPKLYCSPRCRNTQAARDAYKAQQLPARHDPGEIRICKNERCSQTVPESKNSGVPRLYCSPRCARNQGSRNAYGRHFGPLRNSAVTIDSEGRSYVRRTVAYSAEAAKNRLFEHENTCSLGEDKRCPSRNDIYGAGRLCQVWAVLAEDWHMLRRQERGNEGVHAFVRTQTTLDGYWLPEQWEIDAIETDFTPLNFESELERFP